MAVTLYLFDSQKKVRAVVTKGISELIHDESAWTVTAEIPAKYKADAGEFIGFACVDGRFRLFEIDTATDDEIRNVTEITAVDAAIADLQASICERAQTEETQAPAAVQAILSGSGWTLGKAENGTRTAAVNVYYLPRWEALQELETACGVRIEPYYEISGGEIVRRVVDATAITPVYRGRFVQQGWDADNVQFIRSESPRPKIFPLGAVLNTDDGTTQRLTIADAVWSKANGDPVDKPEGQTWIGVPEAMARYPGREKKLERDDIDSLDKLMQAAWEEAKKAAQPKTLAQGTISDMEMVAGQSWKAVRKWDYVYVKAKNREGAMVQVLRIERNYVRPHLTKMTMGDEEPETMTRRMARLTSSSLSAERTLKSHGYGIGGLGSKLSAMEIEVDENKTTIKSVAIELDAANARIDLKATKEELSQAEHRISQAEIEIDGANAAIALKADQTVVQGIEERVSKAEVNIDGANAAIALKAEKSTVTELEKRVSSAEIRIDGAEAEIELKVNKNGVISAINLSSEAVTISSAKINLVGYVTTSKLSSELAEIRVNLASLVETYNLRAEFADIGSMALNEHGCKWKTDEVVTGITRPVLAGKTIWYVDNNGNTQNLWVATGWSTQLSATKKEVNYLGYSY